MHLYSHLSQKLEVNIQVARSIMCYNPRWKSLKLQNIMYKYIHVHVLSVMDKEKKKKKKKKKLADAMKNVQSTLNHADIKVYSAMECYI